MDIIGDTFTEDHDKVFAKVFDDILGGNVPKVPNAHWDSIGTFRDSPTDICIARTLLSIPRTVLNLVMGRKNLE